MKSYKSKRDFIKIHDAFRLDWQKAIKEASLYRDKILTSKRTSFDDRVTAMGIYCEIDHMYSKDDVDGYLRYLDNHRDLLKLDTYSQIIGPRVVEL